jgi:hypothetical protein
MGRLVWWCWIFYEERGEGRGERVRVVGEVKEHAKGFGVDGRNGNIAVALRRSWIWYWLSSYIRALSFSS